MGILLGFISTGANLFVPQLAQKLINNFKSISPTLAILTVVIFIAGLITSALSGLLLGIFGENVVSKLRKQLWQKLLKMPVKYFDDVKTGEISSRLVNDTSQVKDLTCFNITKCNDIAFTIRWCTGYYVSNGLADDIVDVCGSSFSDFSHATSDESVA